MGDPTWPKLRDLKVWAPVGGLASVAVIVVAALMLRPHPQPVALVVHAPEWRCAPQAKGDPICVRKLPPAAKPPPR